MSDTPDFSTFNWPNSQQGSQSDTVDPAAYSQAYNSQPSSQRGNGFGSQRDSPVQGVGNGGTGNASSSTAPARDSTEYANFNFGPSGSQSASQQGSYYNINGGVDPSQTSYQAADSGASYTPIDPALTAPPQRQGGNSFSQDPSAQQQGNASYLSQHVPPSNFNPGRRYSTPALSSVAPYHVPRRSNMFPPSQFTQRSTEAVSSSTSSTAFAQPPPRSPAFSSPVRSYPQGFNVDRRMSMPANSLWQLAHQNAPPPAPSTLPPHSEPRPRQHSMVDWRLPSQTAPVRSDHSNPLLADLDASQGMLSLRGTVWGHDQSSSGLDFNSELDERRAGYDPNLVGGAIGYDTGRRASVDSNATQTGGVIGEGMKKHICTVCQKKFTRPSSLQTHLYSHTGEKRISLLILKLKIAFKCDHEGCGRSFSVVSNLRRHKKIHSNSNGK
jgi:uncharacterized Zn-finger protein